MMAKHGPNRIAKGQGWAAGNEWKDSCVMLASGHSHWHGSRCQLVRFMAKAPLFHMGTYIGKELWKMVCHLLSLILEKASVSLAGKTMTLAVSKHEMAGRNWES